MGDSSDVATRSVTTNGHSKEGNAVSLKSKTWQEKLITHEDAFHHHKILGILVLIVMLTRFAMAGKETDMGFLSHPQFTIPTLLLHTLLNVSSFHFRIPLRRIKDGTRVWPEYRMHAAIFALRSSLTILLYYFERIYHWEPNYNMNFLIVMVGLLATDLASYSVTTKYQSRSVRDVETHPLNKFAISFIQFTATAGMLFGVRRHALPYSYICVVQITPFLGTLRRKQVLTSKLLGAFLFGSVLLSSAIFVTLDYLNDDPKTIWIVRSLGQIAALQRMTPLPSSFSILQNKYVVWTTAFLLLRYIRAHIDEFPVPFLRSLCFTTLFLCLLLGGYKSHMELRQEKFSVKIKSV